MSTKGQFFVRFTSYEIQKKILYLGLISSILSLHTQFYAINFALLHLSSINEGFWEKLEMCDSHFGMTWSS